MVICLERGADLHMAQLMPLPLTVSCFSKIQIGFTFLVPAYLGRSGKGPLNRCVCVYVANWLKWLLVLTVISNHMQISLTRIKNQRSKLKTVSTGRNCRS